MLKWFRTLMALLLIAIAIFVVRWLTDERTALIATGMVLVTFVAFALFMDDTHARWIVSTKNIPAWGQVVAAIAVFVFVGPMLWQALRSAVEAVFGAFEATRCILSGASLVALLSLIALNNRRRRRRTS